MSDEHGKFAWYELMTTDVAAAKAFYGRVFGWAAENATPEYSILSSSAGRIAGILDMPRHVRESGTGSAWFGYVSVDDVDDYAARFAAAGGTIYRPGEDIPGIGRFAMVADP